MATLGTYRRSGEVLLSPVWFELRDGGFALVVGRSDFKAQHIRRDPRASITVYEGALPLRGLELRGTARLSTDGLHELRMRIWQRYAGSIPIATMTAEQSIRRPDVFRTASTRRLPSIRSRCGFDTYSTYCGLALRPSLCHPPASQSVRRALATAPLVADGLGASSAASLPHGSWLRATSISPPHSRDDPIGRSRRVMGASC